MAPLWSRVWFGSAEKLDSFLPDFSTFEGLDRLREQGFSIDHFRNPKSFDRERNIFSYIKKYILRQTLQENSTNIGDVQTVVGIVLEFLLKPLSRIDAFTSFPCEEYKNLAKLTLQSVESKQPLLIAVPVCPDYPESGYEMGTGAGITAKRFLNIYPAIVEVFKKFGISIQARIDVADADGIDPFLSQKLGVTRDEFFRRIQHTRQAIQMETETRGLSTEIEVASMLETCAENGFDYVKKQEEYVEELLKLDCGKPAKVFSALISERLRKQDFQLLGLTDESEYKLAAAYELAGYAAYGETIGNSAVICSPDAQSAIPAYNMLKKDKYKISPVIGIKSGREHKNELFYE